MEVRPRSMFEECPLLQGSYLRKRAAWEYKYAMKYEQSPDVSARFGINGPMWANDRVARPDILHHEKMDGLRISPKIQ